MNLPFFISKRYLFSKKSRNIINLISGVSLAGISIGTLALVVILSFFNGLEDLIKSMFGAFDPDLKISLNIGKTFDGANPIFDQIRNDPSVAVYTEVLEENALLDYRDRQVKATLKGVSDNFNQLTGIDSLLTDGTFRFYQGDLPMGIIGSDLAYQLSVGLNFFEPIKVYVAKASSSALLNPAGAFSQEVIWPSGIFSVQQEYDSKYFIVSLEFIRNLLRHDTELTNIELGLIDDADGTEVKDKFQNILGQEYIVEDKADQHKEFYKVMAVEKWAVYLILALILIIASFNTISSLTLLIIEKKKDMQILRSMGALPSTIRKIFLYEGLLVTVIGLGLGLLLGALFCWVQMKFGIVRFPSSGSFIVDAYPIKMLFSDFLLVALLVLVIGWTAAAIPVRLLWKRYFSGINDSNFND